MRTQFAGLEMMRRALFASQRALDLVGQNISNTNTRGYSRQELSLYAAPPFPAAAGQGLPAAGAGVTDASPVRYREEFFDRQYRQRSADLGAATVWDRVYSQVEQVLGAGEGTLAHLMDRLWSSLQGLVSRPDQADARLAVRQAAADLVAGAQAMDAGLQTLRRSLDDTLVLEAERINAVADELARINGEVTRTAADPAAAPNALLDQRDRLLDELSRLAGAQWQTAGNGQVIVFLTGTALVLGTGVNHIRVARPGAAAMAGLTWEKGGLPVTFPGGELAATQQARDSGVPQFQGHLQTLLTALVQGFNAANAAGYYAPGASGPAVFTFTPDPGNPARVDVASISVSVTPAEIAAAAGAAAAPQDNGNARRLAGVLDARLVTDPLTGAGPVSPVDFNRAVMGQAGILAERHRRAANVAALQQQQAENMRQSIAGVSLDEEMTRMIQFQHAYAAAARMVTTMDEAIDTIVNRMGLVGR